MKNLISQGVPRKLIRLEDNDKYIVYIDQNKRRNKGRKPLKDEPTDKIEANGVRFDLKDWSAIRFDEPNALRNDLAKALVAHYTLK